MSLNDEPEKRAALAVMTDAILWARMRGWEGSSSGLSAKESEQLGDLMDAVHNLPNLFISPKISYESLLVSSLRDYDTKWGTSLAADYERVRSGPEGEKG